MPEFRRRHLHHETPNWVPDNASYFITICALPRGENHLAHDQIAQAIYDAIKHYYTSRWYAELILVMPDHIHGIFTFNLERYQLRNIFMPCKSYLAKTHGINWQDDFFDHRLRDNREYIEKAEYIRQNPVRAALVEKAADWPYVWDAFSS